MWDTAKLVITHIYSVFDLNVQAKFHLETSRIIEEGTTDLTDATDQCGLSVPIRRICLIRGFFCLNMQSENALDQITTE
jgi:hypothetical protein